MDAKQIAPCHFCGEDRIEFSHGMCIVCYAKCLAMPSNVEFFTWDETGYTSCSVSTTDPTGEIAIDVYTYGLDETIRCNGDSIILEFLRVYDHGHCIYSEQTRRYITLD